MSECPELKQRKDGTYYAQLDLGTDPETGKRRRPLKSFPGMNREDATAAALLWCETMRSELLGTALEAYNGTFPVRSTRKTYESARRRIRPLWGVPVRAITVAMLNNEFARLLKIGLAEPTVRLTKEYLSGAFRRFVSEGICDSNPVVGTMRLRQSTTHGQPIDDESLSLIVGWVGRELANTPDDIAGILKRNLAFSVWLTLRIGVRIGEVCALRRQDINLRKGFVTVNGTMSGSKRQEHTKSHSDRTIPIAEEDHETIREHMTWQRSYLSKVYGSTPILTIDGSHLYGDKLERAFKRMLEELRIGDPYTYHSLRHTNSTLLLQAGMNVNEVQQRLGHYSASLTVDTYGHSTNSARDSGASSAINRQLRDISDQF